MRKEEGDAKARQLLEAVLILAASGIVFFGTLWIVTNFADSFMVYKNNRAYLPPLIQIPILAVAGASIVGGLWGLVRLVLVLAG